MDRRRHRRSFVRRHRGLTGFFAAIAVGFCLYAVLLVFAVTQVKVPYQPKVAAASTP
jgi:hypothetical protein